jgi:histidine triad (HIT) family protein
MRLSPLKKHSWRANSVSSLNAAGTGLGYTSYMPDSIFTKIIRGDIPCYKIYENEQVIAFLDINPILPGHTLVVPKIQIDYVDELPDEQYAALMRAVKIISTHLRQVLQMPRTVELVMGYDVPHAHVHLIPSISGSQFYTAMAQRVSAADTMQPNHQDLVAIAQKLAF